MNLGNESYTPVIEVRNNKSSISKSTAEIIAKNYIERLGYNPNEFKDVYSTFKSDKNWCVSFNENDNMLDGGLTVIIGGKTQEPVGYCIDGCRYFYKTDKQGNIISTIELDDYGHFAE